MAERQVLPVLALSIITLLSIFSTTTSQILEPPYFNLAYGKQIVASSTCGEGVTEPELFCKLTGADAASQGLLGNYEVIQGQLCDYCVPGHPAQAHPAYQALDGKETWWQSPPLSRGLEYDKVNLTIDLGQEFHVAYVFIKMANSPRPGVFALEKSADYGKTWQAWQYFADTPSDCRAFFGDNYQDSIRRDNSVICTSEYSKVVPLEGGEIVLSLVNNRPSANNFSSSDSLQEWTKATNVRLRLLRTKTLLGHLISVYTGQDPTVTRRYFYSIKDISIGGRCVCNGHAESCDLTDENDPTRLLCRCQHNTCGAQCDTCCPNYVQKPWQPAHVNSKFYECEPCQCYGHSLECIYDEEVAEQGLSVDIHGEYAGGGVCQNCQHFTEGINCEKCIFGYYRPEGQPLDSPYACTRCNCDLTYSTGDCEDNTGRCVCKPQYTGPFCQQCSAGYYDPPNCYACTCNVNGTAGQYCGEGAYGQCPCKPNYAGRTCDQCDYGYYGFPDCQACGCDYVGALDVNQCDPYSGQCRCNPNFGGRNCGECAKGYYAYPQCRACDCDLTGTIDEICDQYNGLCQCKDGFGGPRCDRCEVGYYRYPSCMECGCNEDGSVSNECDSHGQCFCKEGFAGQLCDQCQVGYYRYPECLQCNCDYYGSMPGQTCDDETGQCICRPTFDGLTCNKCRPNYYNYPMCEECNCNPAGAMEVPGHPLGGCGARITGQLCECKDRVEGRVCDVCKNGFWNLDIVNPHGCEDCSCYRPGTVGGNNICSQENGQCGCKPFTSGRRCDVCVDGTYNLQENNVFGCMDCGCDIGGSISQVCDKISGECTCRLRVQGVKCDQPLDVHYFPTLHQHQFEAEDGHTVRGGAVRYGFDEDIFPGYSWRGYAILSDIQDTVVLDIDITKPSLYRIIIRYVSRNSAPISADVTFTPESAADVTQYSTVLFPTNYDPEFVADIATFVLNPGPWMLSITSVDTLYIDYIVLVPQDYYEATQLSKEIHHNPCTVPSTDSVCKHYVYVDISAYPIAHGEDGWTSDLRDELAQLYPEDDVISELGTTNMAHLNVNQRDLYLELDVPNPGLYILVLQYHSEDVDHSQTIDLELIPEEGESSFSSVVLPGCPYSSLCRQVVTDSSGNPMSFDIPGSKVGIYILGYEDVDLAVDSVIAIPLDEWTYQFISPQLKCIRMDKQCLETEYETVSGTIRVEVEEGPNQDNVATDLPPHIIDTSVGVIKMDANLPTITVKGSIVSPGPHVFIVHYYQPYHVGFDVPVNITVDTTTTQGHFTAEYCPSVSGCRAVVVFDDLVGESSVQVNNYDYVLSFENPSQNPLWLDYINVIPEGTYTTKVLDVKPIDLASVFIKKCTYDDYYVPPGTSGFCADSIFSLTTNENNGALPCNCNDRGSLKFNCDVFGGQCECREHVIGRDCSRCRTGYFGFPNCRRCNCPSGLCDSDSGQCVCPPNVGGDKCDTCYPQTFGFDPIIGCEECNCNPRGVDNGQMECDFNTGQCSCKPNVGGRRCDKCLPGYYQFPDCQPCACDLFGSEPDVCDQNTAQCLCKENVVGPQCSQCQESTFYLEDRNKKGCTHCYCFGTTQRCTSSNYIQTQVRDMRGWGITNLLVPDYDYDSVQNLLTAKIESDNVDNPEQAIYWVAPDPYLGNKVTSYGGRLQYAVTFTLPVAVESAGLIKQDIRIEGNGFTLVRIMPEQPSEGVELDVSVDMLESMFVHELSGASVSREQFMTLLANVESLQIRASYFTVVDSVTLRDVSLDHAKPDDGGFGQLALNVEQCECPVAYQGTSCEDCAPGFYRLNQLCVPCQCNGRADTCDPVSGECTNCRDNFGGAQCEACRQGYYYDDYFGRCESCACPYAAEEDNHASTCVVYNGVVERCICLPGYTGDRCDSCEYGHYGDPLLPGGTCTPCSGGCNDNIDARDPGSCDQVTGACLTCINNAGGDHCEVCADWYWGDAITRKDCQMCDCNVTGSELCDDRTGSCLCKPHVEGIHCDRCEPGAFGFETGNGCQECDCSEGAQGSSCDIVTGQCVCQQGVTGRRCDQCQPGYWNFGSFGCTKCQCDYEGAVTCDSLTGVCQCLPGVTGPRCDECEERWILVEGYGCQECDSCVHRLLDDVDAMESNVTYIMEDLDSVSVGVGAIKRLDKISKQVDDYRPQVDDLFISGGFDDSVLDPIDAILQDVQADAHKALDLSERLARESEVMVTDAFDVLEETDGLSDAVRMGVEKSREAVHFAEEVLQDILTSIDTVNVDRLIADGETSLEEMRRHDFSGQDLRTEDELDKALDALADAQAQLDTAMEQAGEVDELKKHMDDVEMRLRDLMNSSRHSLDLSQTAVDLNTDNHEASTSIKENSEAITQSKEDSDMMLDMADELLTQAQSFIDDADIAYGDVITVSSQLDRAVEQLRGSVDELRIEDELRHQVNSSLEHAYALQKQARDLDNLLADTRESAEGALNASKAYQAIVDAISMADTTADDAIIASQNAKQSSEGISNKARNSYDQSGNLIAIARETKESIQTELHPRLDEAVRAVDVVDELNRQTEDGLTDFLLGIKSVPEGVSDRASRAATQAMEAQNKAEESARKVENIVDQLPEDQQRANQIVTDIEEANSDIRRADKQVQNVMDLVPEANELLSRLSEKADRVNRIGNDLTESINKLKDNIAISREEASRIRLGQKFYLNTTLQLRNPPNLVQAGSYTKLSMFFKTGQPDGFLAYIGPDRTSGRVQTDDHIALEIVDGKINFKFYLGDMSAGPAVIVNDKIVNDNEWHEVIVERTGKVATVIVRTEEEEDSVSSGQVEGTFSVLDLNPATTKFYIGGVPDSAGLDDKLDSLHIVGCIEDVKFDGIPIGLWNFVHGQNNHNGCVSRDKLIGSQSNGFRFDGNGAVVIETGYHFKPKIRSLITLKFKTFAENGLMFLLHGEQDFLSIEMKDGLVLLQYDLGSGTAELKSTETYNDGRWHSVVANRLNVDGLLKVDNETAANGRSPGDKKDLDVSTSGIYIGGFYPGMHDFEKVTHQGFEGCIKDVELAGTLKDLNNNLFAKGVTPGCPQVSRIISFTPDEENSYLAMDPVNVDRNFESTLKMKTQNSNGLIYYVANNDQTSSLAVSVIDGRIVVIANSRGSIERVETSVDTYNDGSWHYVTVTKNGAEMQLDIDDHEMVKTSLTRRRIPTTTPFYFGGVPAGYQLEEENVGTTERFVGCVGDVTVNGGFINFALAPASAHDGASLGRCGIPDPTTSLSTMPTLMPIVPNTGAPEPTDSCALPLEPAETGGGSPEDVGSTRFGLQRNSRFEFDALPTQFQFVEDGGTGAADPNNPFETLEDESNFTLEFKTDELNGVLFYMADNRHVDYIALYLSDGQVTYSFNCGSGPAVLTSPYRYNDGEWHRVEFSRRQNNGTLNIDGINVTDASSIGNTRSINVAQPYYVGGLSVDVAEKAAGNLQGVTNSFVGCIRNMKTKGQDFPEPASQFYTEPCSLMLETGSFMYADGGYIKAMDNFKVGLDLEISMDIKPRTMNGVLFSITTASADYLALQLKDGKVIFNVENGNGEFSTEYDPPTTSALCDGQWHNIKAVKNKNVVTLYVDSVFTYPGLGEVGVSSTDTNDPVYIGGRPDEHESIKTTEQYVGCIRNIQLKHGGDYIDLDLSQGEASGHVKLNGCPVG